VQNIEPGLVGKGRTGTDQDKIIPPNKAASATLSGFRIPDRGR